MPAGQPRFVSDQSPVAAEVEVQPAIPNPFDYFSNDPSDDTLSPESLGPDPFGSRNADTAVSADSDPSSLSVGRHSRSVVDTITDHSTLSRLPDAGMAPIVWSVAPQTPNPVGQWLTRQACVEGLWDNYQAQRAQECVHMWEHLSGHEQMACGTCGPCSVCSGTHVRNRYKASRDCGCNTQKCDHLPQCSQCAQTPLPPPPALPVSSNANGESTSNDSRDSVAQAATPFIR